MVEILLIILVALSLVSTVDLVIGRIFAVAFMAEMLHTHVILATKPRGMTLCVSLQI